MTPAASRPSSPSTWLWIGLVALASLGLSRAFACATPLAALATFAAFTLRRTQGVALVLVVWIANQAIGFGLLHYPCTASTFGWGLAIGVASLAALAASEQVSRHGASLWNAPLGLAVAFGAYELVLFATTWLLPSGRDAFAAGVVLRIFAIDAVSLGLLIAATRAAAALGHHPAAPRTRPSP